MITAGWLDWTAREPGPPQKRYTADNAGEGIVWHSMEGTYAGSLRELQSIARQASWMFSLRRGGELVQHYPIAASCWASGNRAANTAYWSCELEGFSNEPISATQLPVAMRLIREWEAWKVRKAVRRVSMWEHREVATIDVPNAGPTACPSERYAPLWAALEEEDDDMSDEYKAKVDRLERLLAANGIDTTGDNVADTFGEDALRLADTNGWSAFLGIGIARQDLANHQAAHPGASTVADHTHDPGGVTQ